MGARLAQTVSAVERFSPAFGRAERIDVDGREVRIMLAKNPTGLNEVLHALQTSDDIRRHLLLLLNDRPADGEDVSWIWDADFERVPRIARSVVVSGTRAADLAVRLKYACVAMGPAVTSAELSPVAPGEQVDPPASCAHTAAVGADLLPLVVEPDVPRALDAALGQVAPGESLFIVPTYTAMLAVRTELERRGYAKHYWETADA
jgi:UDP-N-acetylmuramyl tripeptide synthase